MASLSSDYMSHQTSRVKVVAVVTNVFVGTHKSKCSPTPSRAPVNLRSDNCLPLDMMSSSDDDTPLISRRRSRNMAAASDADTSVTQSASPLNLTRKQGIKKDNSTSSKIPRNIQDLLSDWIEAHSVEKLPSSLFLEWSNINDSLMLQGTWFIQPSMDKVNVTTYSLNGYGFECLQNKRILVATRKIKTKTWKPAIIRHASDGLDYSWFQIWLGLQCSEEDGFEREPSVYKIDLKTPSTSRPISQSPADRAPASLTNSIFPSDCLPLQEHAKRLPQFSNKQEDAISRSTLQVAKPLQTRENTPSTMQKGRKRKLSDAQQSPSHSIVDLVSPSRSPPARPPSTFTATNTTAVTVPDPVPVDHDHDARLDNVPTVKREGETAPISVPINTIPTLNTYMLASIMITFHRHDHTATSTSNTACPHLGRLQFVPQALPPSCRGLCLPTSRRRWREDVGRSLPEQEPG